MNGAAFNDLSAEDRFEMAAEIIARALIRISAELKDNEKDTTIEDDTDSS